MALSETLEFVLLVPKQRNLFLPRTHTRIEARFSKLVLQEIEAETSLCSVHSAVVPTVYYITKTEVLKTEFS